MSKIELYIGASAQVELDIISEESGRPFDLSSITDIEVSFPQNPSSRLVKNLAAGVTVVNGVLGQITIDLSKEETALLLSGPSQVVFCSVDLSASDRKIVEIGPVLDVNEYPL